MMVWVYLRLVYLRFQITNLDMIHAIPFYINHDFIFFIGNAEWYDILNLIYQIITINLFTKEFHSWATGYPISNLFAKAKLFCFLQRFSSDWRCRCSCKSHMISFCFLCAFFHTTLKSFSRSIIWI